MDSSNGPTLIWGVTMIVLVASSLIARRIPMAQFFRYLLLWAVIGTGVYGLVLFRGEIGQVWDRARADLGIGSPVTVSGSETIVRKSTDGHFWIEGTMNNRPVRFLIDSGATVTAVNAEDALAAGLIVDRSDFPEVVITANGPINSWRSVAGTLSLGSIRVENMPVHVSDVEGSENLLGMNWLSRLRSWRVEGDRMILTP
jgi:aspartyl protease family protein